MTTIEKVSCFPNEGTPQVIAGDPVLGDLVRITTGNTVIYERYTPPAAPPVATAKTARLSWDEFRKLFTDAELEGLDSYDDGTIILTPAQKRKIKTFLEKGKARGYDRAINLASGGISAAIDYLVARGFIDGTGDTRKTEILAGVIKS